MVNDIEVQTWLIGNAPVKTIVYTAIKKGSVIMGESEQEYDLRYCTDTDLHRAMINDFISRGMNFTNEIMLS